MTIKDIKNNKDFLLLSSVLSFLAGMTLVCGLRDQKDMMVFLVFMIAGILGTYGIGKVLYHSLFRN